jgi:hypothetical protein
MFASIAGRFCLCAASPCDPRDVGSQRPDLGRPLTVGRNLLNLISIFTSGGSLMSGFFESHLPIAGRRFRHQADHHLPDRQRQTMTALRRPHTRGQLGNKPVGVVAKIRRRNGSPSLDLPVLTRFEHSGRI